MLSTFLLQNGFTGKAHVTLVTPLLCCAALIDYPLPNQVMLKSNHVQKNVAVPFFHLDILVKTYRLLASGAIPGTCLSG